MLGFKLLRRAQMILADIEIVSILRKGLIYSTESKVLSARRVFYHLVG